VVNELTRSKDIIFINLAQVISITVEEDSNVSF